MVSEGPSYHEQNGVRNDLHLVFVVSQALYLVADLFVPHSLLMVDLQRT